MGKIIVSASGGCREAEMSKYLEIPGIGIPGIDPQGERNKHELS